MILLLIGFIIGGITGIVLMTILAVSKKDDELVETLIEKISLPLLEK